MLFTVFMISFLVTESVGNVKANHQEGDKGKKIVKRATNCYDDLGCFSNSPPYDNTLIDSVPQSPTEIGTSFLLYTRNNPTNEEVFVAGAVPSNFQAGSNTVFIIHGWTDHGRNWWIKAMTSALLTKASLNVIAVDWEEGSNNLLYDQSATDIRVVGAQVAQLIGFLNAETGTTNSRYHIIGHSLGAHAAGYAGERLRGLRRISGLDPAGLYFEKKDELVRLDPSDATFVDVIHTDGGTLLSLSLGLEQAIGAVDFYPNGGHDQPGCNSIDCNHIRALHLYIESINSECPFAAYPCSNESQWESLQCESNCGTGCSVMGYNVDPNTIPGKYYWYTRSSSPFCVGNVQANHNEEDKGTKTGKRATKCYDDLGCFSNSPPYDNTLIDTVPQSPTEIGTSFLLYTRNNPTNEEVFVAGAVPSNFQAVSNTVFIIHGWTDHGRNSWIKAMTNALLAKASLNVIAVHWEKGASNVYDQSATDIRVVGAQVAQLIGFLNAETGTTNSRYHIIGHSLGAHAAGYAGERLQGLRRISGLDPAGLYFEKKDELVRLDPNDATFVDVIHTDGGTLLSLSLGLEKAIGDVDFYPNGGHDQPGCNVIPCSHNRVLDLYTESINSECPFTAYPCSSESQWESLQCESNCGTGCGVMGYQVDPHLNPGTYYLYTRSSSPFCGYLYRFNMLLSGEPGYSYGDVLVTLHGTKGDSTSLKRESEIYNKNEKHSIRGFLSTDIGEVTGVTITFKKGSGVLAWFSSSKLRVAGIEVVDTFGQRKGKCFGSVTLKDEEAQSFDISLSTSLAAC